MHKKAAWLNLTPLLLTERMNYLLASVAFFAGAFLTAGFFGAAGFLAATGFSALTGFSFLPPAFASLINSLIFCSLRCHLFRSSLFRTRICWARIPQPLGDALPRGKSQYQPRLGQMQLAERE